MKKCLGCWEQIDSSLKVCPYCGTNQEEVVEYLKLAMLAQQRKPLASAKKSKIKAYLETIDPSISISKETVSDKQKYASPQSTMQPYVPSTLPSSLTTSQKPLEVEKEPLIVCPNCKKSVKKTKFCKYCGNELFKECPNCGEQVSVKAKFCPSCGNSFSD